MATRGPTVNVIPTPLYSALLCVKKKKKLPFCPEYLSFETVISPPRQHASYKANGRYWGLWKALHIWIWVFFLPAELLPLHFYNFTRRIQLTTRRTFFSLTPRKTNYPAEFSPKPLLSHSPLINLGLTTAESNNCFLVFLLRYAMGFTFYK